VPFTAVGSELLFEVFSQRYERGATLVTSNLPFDEWTSVFGSERLTGALLDRLTHHVHILESRVEDGRGGLGPIGQHPVSRHRVTGGDRSPPVPTERGVRISRTTLFDSRFTAPRGSARPDREDAV
jgi:hypothetical protein